MSKSSSLRDVAATARMHSFGRPIGGPTRVHMRQTRYGTWVVREEGDRRGGNFFTQDAALKFIRSEFGTDAQITATYFVHKQAA